MAYTIIRFGNDYNPNTGVVSGSIISARGGTDNCAYPYVLGGFTMGTDTGNALGLSGVVGWQSGDTDALRGRWRTANSTPRWFGINVSSSLYRIKLGVSANSYQRNRWRINDGIDGAPRLDVESASNPSFWTDEESPSRNHDQWIDHRGTVRAIGSDPLVVLETTVNIGTGILQFINGGHSSNQFSSDISFIAFEEIVAPRPTITSISPTSGSIGTQVTMIGTMLSGSFSASHGVSAPMTNLIIDSDTQIRATITSGSPASAPILVTAPQGTATSPIFTIIPIFTSLEVSDPNTLYSIGELLAPIEIRARDQYGRLFLGTVPSGSFSDAGFCSVTSLTLGVSVIGTLSEPFIDGVATFDDLTPVSSSALTFTSISPTSGSIGTQVTMTGVGFTGATGATHGPTVAMTGFVVDSNTQARATIASGSPATGTIRINTVSGSLTGPVFTIIPVYTSATIDNPNTQYISGSLLTPITVTALDQFGSVFTGSVANFLASNLSLPVGVIGTTSVPFVSGIATFNNLTATGTFPVIPDPPEPPPPPIIIPPGLQRVVIVPSNRLKRYTRQWKGRNL